jgi:hypothetical protein
MSKEIVAQKSCIEKFLRIVHPTNGRICLVIINRDTGEVNERYTTPSRIPKFISFLRYCNANGCDIYFTPSELKPNRKRKRKKSNFLDLQSIIYLEFDQPNTLDSLLSAIYPYPSAIVASSEGRHHVYWCLAGAVSKHRQEELMANIARDVGSDTVATDTSRLLRLPTFCNKKPSRDNFRASLIYPDQEMMIKPTTFDDLASAVENYQEAKSSSIPSGAAAPTCASSSENGQLSHFAKSLAENGSVADLGQTFAAQSQSGRDWFLVNDMLFAKGDDPQKVIKWLEGQSERKLNPHYYAKRTVGRALMLKGDIRYALL